MNEYLNYLNNLKIPKQHVGTFVSMFSGGGGLDLGLEFAGFRCVFASDLEPSYCATVAQNLKTIAEPHDICELSASYIFKTIGGKQPIDLMAGGPPCQAFSILGNRKSINDPRGK
ncbi:MAG: DNA cytosine methyltransferase, partial [Elusimicrobiota bacterium]